jgi:O-antigen ligase
MKYIKTKKTPLVSATIPVLLITIIIAIAPWATYTQIAFLTTPVSICVFSLTIFSLIHYFLNKNGQNIYKEDLPLVFFIALLCASYFVSLHSEAWPLVAFWYTACIATYISTKMFFSKKEFLKISSFGAILGVIITFVLVGPTENEYGILSDRQSAPNHNSNFTAYCLAALVFIIKSNLFMNNNSKVFKLFSYFSIALSIYIVILLGTRGAIISINLLIFCFIIIKFVGRSTYQALIYVAIAASAVTALGLFESVLSWVDALSTRSDGELAGRTPSWEIARTYFLDHPLLGVGAGAFQFVNPMEIGAHNTLLAVAMDTGILGVVTLLIWIAINFAHIKLKEPQKSQMAVLWLAYALPISLSGEWILSPLVWITFGILFGLKDSSQSPRARR